MFLGESDDLITPFLRHPKFEEFEKKTPRLQELTNQISAAIKIQMAEIDHHFLGIRFLRIDPETEAAFKEFAEICKHGLK